MNVHVQSLPLYYCSTYIVHSPQRGHRVYMFSQTFEEDIRVIQIWEITSFLGLIYGKRGEDISGNSKIGMRSFTTCASNGMW